MRVCFITVHYNTPNEIANYIKSIQLLRPAATIKIVIVDNCSLEENFIRLQEVVRAANDDRIELVRASSNAGYFQGLNTGIRLVNPDEYDYLIVGNNDVSYQNDFLQALKAIRTDEKNLVLAPNIYNTSGYFENPNAVNKISKIRMFFYDVYYTHYVLASLITNMYSFRNKLSTNRRRKQMMNETITFMPVYLCMGSQFILTKSFFKHHKQLREDVFLWSEEALLAYQVRSAGGNILYCPTLKMFHLENASTGQLPSRKKYDIMQNSYWTARKYF